MALQITLESARRASRPAGLGAIAGLLVSASAKATSSFDLTPSGVAFFCVLGSLSFWWIWLFWGAVIQDFRLRIAVAVAWPLLAGGIFWTECDDINLANRFRQDGAETQGTVTGVFPENHNHLGYQYAVAGDEFAGNDFAPGNARDFGVGDKLTIFYLKSEPSTSASTKPIATVMESALASTIGSLWLVSGVVIFRFYGGGSDASKKCSV